MWHTAKFYFTCISGLWILIIVPSMKKIHLAIIGECARIRLTDRLDSFLYSPIPLKQSRK